MTNIDAQRIKEIRNNTKEMTYYMKSIAKSFERIADALESKADTPQTDKNDRSTAEFITGTQIGDAKPIPNSTTTWASTNTPQTERGYMWTCPKCGTENHSDFTKCPCCGEPKTEPYEDEFEVCDSRNGCYGCEHHICKLEQTEPQTERSSE